MERLNAVINKVIVSKFNKDIVKVSIEGKGFGTTRGHNNFFYKNQEIIIKSWRDNFIEGYIPVTSLDDVKEYYDSIQDNFNIYNITATFSFKINTSLSSVYSQEPESSTEIISGVSSFNSVQGRVVVIGKTLTNINYKVFLRLKSPTYYNNIGQYFVTEKTTTQFTVKNLGDNCDAEFEWFIIPHENSLIFSGTSYFNGNDGRLISIGGILPCANYRVLINPIYTGDENRVGEFAVFNKTKTSFVVKNTGEDITTRFDWVVIGDGAVIFKCGANTSPVLMGQSTFNSLEGRIINIDSQMSNTNYRVVITPTNSLTTQVGEVVIYNKSKSYFTVKNTGEDISSSFDWILIPSYDDNNYCQTGSAIFNSREGVRVDFENVQDDLNYAVIITPKQTSLLGDIGDVYVGLKEYTHFTVHNIGENNYDTFDWTLIPADNGVFKLGSSNFSSLNGRLVALPESFPDLHYKVAITPKSNTASSLSSQLGAYGIVDRTSTGFTLANTGEDVTTELDWVAIDFNNPDIHKGTGTFNSNSGTIINLITPLENVNYTVCILPNSISLAIGEISVFDKKTNQFTVRITGEDVTSTFDWFIVPHRFKYFENNYYVGTKIYVGSSVFNGPSGRVVAIGDTLSNNKYHVSLMPEKTELVGKLGDYGVVNKTRSQFTVKNSGEDVTSGFGWLLVLEDDSVSGTAVFNSVDGRIINFETPLDTNDYEVYLSYDGQIVDNIGEWYIESKTVNGFTVKNVGTNRVNVFEWWVLKNKTMQLPYSYDYRIKPIYKQLGNMAFEDEIVSGDFDKDRIINGTSVFNGLEGRDIIFNYPLHTKDYFVGVFPTEDSSEIGDITIINKSREGFTVKNWGTDDYSKFDWILIPNNKNYDGFIFGKSVFGSNDGVKIKLPERMGNKNYFVFVNSSTQELNGDIGSIIVTEKDKDNFTVRNTGENNYSLFDYVVIPEVRESYFSASGSGIFNGEDGTVIPIGRDLDDTNYQVFLSIPFSSANVGEFYISNKFKNYFVVKNTDGNRVDVFNWILLDHDTYTENMGENVFNSITGRKVYLNKPVIDENYSVYVIPMRSEQNEISIGNIWVSDRTKDYFVISNTGNNDYSRFMWLVVSNFETSMYKGRAQFNGTAGTVVNIGTTLSDNYNVLVLPNTTFNGGNIGNVSVIDKTSQNFKLSNTGNDNISKINWISELDSLIAGKANFMGKRGVKIPLSSPMFNSRYHVFITPTSNINGLVGEYGVVYKSSNYFIVENTGEVGGSFDYVVIPEDTANHYLGLADLKGLAGNVISTPSGIKTPYRVFTSLDASMNGSIGQVSITDKTVTGFKINNTGNKNHPFEALYLYSSDLSGIVNKGVAGFAGLEGIEVSLITPETRNYRIYISDVNTNTGEYCICERTSTSFRVRNTGEVGGSFNWVLVPEDTDIITKVSGMFNPIDGVTVNFPNPTPNVDYSIYLTPMDYLNGSVGSYEPDEYLDSTFKIKNSGENQVCRISWFVLDSNDIIVNGSTDLNQGLVEINYDFSGEYSVIITPKTSLSLKVGDYGILNKTGNSSFNIGLTGEELQGKFDWFIVPYNLTSLVSKTDTFAGVSGKVLNFDSPMPDLNYKVFITPQDAVSNIGEFYICNRTLYSCVIKNSIEGLNASFKYTVVPNGVKYLNRGKNSLKSTVEFKIPMKSDIYDIYYALESELSNDGQHYYIKDKNATTFTICSNGDNSSSYFDWILIPDNPNYATGSNDISSSGKIVSFGRKFSNKNYFVGGISTTSSPLYSNLSYGLKTKTQVSLYCESNITNHVDYVVLPSNKEFNISGVSTFKGINGITVNINAKMPNTHYQVYIKPPENAGIGSFKIINKTLTSFDVVNFGNINITFEWIIIPKITNEFYIGKSVMNSTLGRNVCVGDVLDSSNYRVFITPTVYYDENIGRLRVDKKSEVKFEIINAGLNTFTNFDWIAIPESNIFNNA